MRAGKPKEAIDMYCHQQDWAAALSVADTCDPASVPSICALQVGVLYKTTDERNDISVWCIEPLYPRGVAVLIHQLHNCCPQSSAELSPL